jgi:hypothetical protein
MKLTLTQRALRPVLNFIVERYFPSGAFFGCSFLDAFDMHDRAKGICGYSAAMYLQRIARKSNAASLSITMNEITDNGEPVGTWHLEISQIDEAKP